MMSTRSAAAASVLCQLQCLVGVLLRCVDSNMLHVKTVGDNFTGGVPLCGIGAESNLVRRVIASFLAIDYYSGWAVDRGRRHSVHGMPGKI